MSAEDHRSAEVGIEVSNEGYPGDNDKVKSADLGWLAACMGWGVGGVRGGSLG
jgi:hypothetical protein